MSTPGAGAAPFNPMQMGQMPAGNMGHMLPPAGGTPGGFSPTSALTPTSRMMALGQRPPYSPAGFFRGGYARGGYPHMVGYPIPPEPQLPQRHFGGGDYVPDSGHGDGRSDHVDAKLSPGEFVMDAETVSLLGNGSNKAGAAKMEEFRQGLRKQKGKALAKGKFSPDAKPPMDYV